MSLVRTHFLKAFGSRVIGDISVVGSCSVDFWRLCVSGGGRSLPKPDVLVSGGRGSGVGVILRGSLANEGSLVLQFWVSGIGVFGTWRAVVRKRM